MKWISVNKSLPEFRQEVLIYETRNDAIRLAQYISQNEWEYCEEGFIDYPPRPSHWIHFADIPRPEKEYQHFPKEPHEMD